jgi:hypothetical protein
MSSTTTNTEHEHAQNPSAHEQHTRSTSTGPRTEAGKANSRANAFQHGLSGEGIVLPADFDRHLQDRKAKWRETFQPVGAFQEWLFDRICIESALADRCKILQIVAIDELALQAGETWEDARRLDAALIFEKLHKHPEVNRLRLIQSKQGCDLLIEAWRSIASDFRRNQGWDLTRTWPKVLDLLGVPHDQREDYLPEQFDDLATFPGGLEWIETQIAALEMRQEVFLNDQDERARLDTQAGLNFKAPNLALLRRYEAAILRRLDWTIRQLTALQSNQPLDPGTPQGPIPTYQPPGEAPSASAPKSKPQPKAKPKPTPTPTPTSSYATAMPNFSPKSQWLEHLLNNPLANVSATSHPTSATGHPKDRKG